ncbi:MAG: hypothetical protein ACR2NX_16440 [Chthoniobacterales bacterium]
MKLKTLALLCALALLASSSVSAVEVTEVEGTAHGFPALLDANGKKLGEGEFLVEVDGDRLSITLSYRLKHGVHTQEKAVFSQKSELVQEEWSWREMKGEDTVRMYTVDFKTQMATARKRENGEMKNWSEKVELKPGRTFLGYGFMIATQNLRGRLVKGETIELETVGFTPQPKVVTVKITHAGREEMEMAGRTLQGDHFLLHPEIPAIAKLFIKVPDTHIWLSEPPAEFLRFEGPFLEPSDPIIRVDLLPGAESGPANPVKKKSDS